MKARPRSTARCNVQQPTRDPGGHPDALRPEPGSSKEGAGGTGTHSGTCRVTRASLHVTLSSCEHTASQLGTSDKEFSNGVHRLRSAL